jgi:hypothetical protein
MTGGDKGDKKVSVIFGIYTTRRPGLSGAGRMERNARTNVRAAAGERILEVHGVKKEGSMIKIPEGVFGGFLPKWRRLSVKS